MDSDKIKHIFDILKPGDIIFTCATSFTAKTVRFITNGQVSHCAIYIGNGQIIEAQLGVKVRTYDLINYLNDPTTPVYYGILNNRDENQISEAISTAKSFLGRSYDLIGQIGVLVKILTIKLGLSKWINFYGKNIVDNNHEFWCSELVAYCFGNITTVDFRYATPEDIAMSTKLNFKQTL